MQKRVFLVHGWEGKPDNHWFPWLSWELKARGFDVYSIGMPHADEPKVSEWISAIKQVVVRPNKDTYFVGHSLGCIAILRYLEKLPAKTIIGGAVFVAGFSNHINIPQIAEFSSLPLDFSKARGHCQKIVNVFSDNDELVPLADSLTFQKLLNGKAVMERGRGHFTKRDGVDALPSVFRSIVDMSASENDL
jgi:predicted alpha/beta hydrolase family esterase